MYEGSGKGKGHNKDKSTSTSDQCFSVCRTHELLESL
jgi:hypothetical protein